MDFDSDVLEKETGLDSDNDSDPPLAHRAAASGDVPLLVHAVKQDPGVLEHRDSEGFTPLAYAVQSEQLHAVKRLVKMGANIDSQDAAGRTCLSVAAYQGWNEGVVYLLRKGASQNISDKSGRTPLHASTYDIDAKTLLSLLQRLSISEINQTDNERMTALHWAAFHDRPEHLRYLLQRGAQALIQDIDGKTPLHWAAQNGCRSCCIILAEDDPDSQLLQRTDNSGKIAIHLAAAAGHHQILQDLARFQQDLYEAEDQDDRTPLHWAAAMGHTECVRTLLKLGVSPNPVDIDGGAPLEYARQAGHIHCCDLLEERLGLRRFNVDSDRDIDGRSTKTDKSNKSAMNFFKGLFSKKEKRVTADKKTIQSKVELPALNVSSRNEVANSNNGALETGTVTNKKGRNRGIPKQLSITSDTTNGFKHTANTAGLDALRMESHSVSDNESSTVSKPKRHRKKKKERHKNVQEDATRPTPYKTDSSSTDLTTNNVIRVSTNLQSMHLSPLNENVRPASISPRTSNANDTILLNHDGLTSKRLGELNPLRTGRVLNGIREVPISTTLSRLRMDHNGKSRSPTPPPPVISLNTKKALPDISPLSVENDTLYYDQKRLRKKYRDATNDTGLDNEIL